MRTKSGSKDANGTHPGVEARGTHRKSEPKKNGAGKGAWGKSGEVISVPRVQKADPNFDPEDMSGYAGISMLVADVSLCNPKHTHATSHVTSHSTLPYHTSPRHATPHHVTLHHVTHLTPTPPIASVLYSYPPPPPFSLPPFLPLRFFETHARSPSSSASLPSSPSCRSRCRWTRSPLWSSQPC